MWHLTTTYRPTFSYLTSYQFSSSTYWLISCGRTFATFCSTFCPSSWCRFYLYVVFFAAQQLPSRPRRLSKTAPYLRALYYRAALIYFQKPKDCEGRCPSLIYHQIWFLVRLARLIYSIWLCGCPARCQRIRRGWSTFWLNFWISYFVGCGIVSYFILSLSKTN